MNDNVFTYSEILNRLYDPVSKSLKNGKTEVNEYTYESGEIINNIFDEETQSIRIL